MTTTDVPRTLSDRLYALLLRTYPAPFRDRFGAGMRYAFSRDHDAARAAGVAALLRFWLSSMADTLASGLAERFASPGRGPADRPPFRSWLTMDWRDGWRSLRATPATTAVAVLSLALGIGANTALFSIFNSLMLRPLPVTSPERLVLMDGDSLTNPIWEEIRSRQHEIAAGAFAWSNERFDLSTGGETEHVDGVFASGEMFDVLGVSATRGRLFSRSDDERAGGPDGPVAVISYPFWQRRFGGAPDAIGRTLSIDRATFTIVGVAARGFSGPEVGRSADILLPLRTEDLVRGRESLLDQRLSWWLNVMLRLRPDQTLAQAAAQLHGVQDQIRLATMPADGKDLRERYLVDRFTLVPASSGRSALRARYELPLQALMVVVALVLLIACANIANLLLARATARRHELGVRLALGASRFRLSRQLLAESVLLAAAGGALGLLFARWGSRALVAQLSTAANHVHLDLPLDWRVLSFTLVVCAATAILFGVAPAVTVSSLSPNDALKERGRGGSGERRAGVRQALVVLQVALSLMLVVTASLFTRSFISLTTRDAGFDRRGVLIASVTLREPADLRLAGFERLREAVAASPGVATAATSFTTPVARAGWNTRIVVAPDSPLGPRERMSWVNAVSPGWFATYGIRLTGGRDIDGRDRPGSPRVALVNRAFARRFLKEPNPIGQRFSEQGPSGEGEQFEVIGIVEDTVYRSLRAPMEPIMFLPTTQWDRPGTTIALGVRSAGAPPLSLIGSVGDAIRRTDPTASVTYFTLSSQLDASLAQDRLLATLSTFFGGLALLLASLGLYGVTAYSVTTRRAEIGIRMALGANRAAVVRMVLARVGLLVAIGLTIGIGASAWASRFLASFLYGFKASDPVMFAAAALVLAGVAGVAGWLPARRAARVDPTIVMREV